MEPIVIKFTPSALGRVEIVVDVQTGDRLFLDSVRFKLDSGSDFTTLSYNDLENLGYEENFLKECPVTGKAITVTGEIEMRCIDNISIKFGDRELQGCRIFFSLDSSMRSLFGSDILKYFNWEINYDVGELRLNERQNLPQLLKGEKAIQIYSLEEEFSRRSKLSGMSHFFTKN